MTQQDRIESMLIVILKNQIRLAQLCYNANTWAVGSEAALTEVKNAAQNAIDFSNAERAVRRS